MLKGVNKKVVEVVDMENEYFERAILFLKPEPPDSDEKTLKQRAGEYIRTIKYTPRRAFSLGRLALGVLRFSAAVGLGLLLANFIH